MDQPKVLLRRMTQLMTSCLIFVFVVIDFTLAQHIRNDGDLRLVDGPSERSGRLEMYRGSTWMSIYDRGDFGHREAVVACRQLGYVSYNTEAVGLYQSGLFGSGSGEERIAWIHCDGRERKLADCLYSLCGGGNVCTSNDQDVAVDCGSDQSLMRGRTGPSSWGGFMLLIIVIFFTGHAYRRRRDAGRRGHRSLIPVPWYHHGRVPPNNTAGASPPGGIPNESFPPEPPGGEGGGSAEPQEQGDSTNRGQGSTGPNNTVGPPPAWEPPNPPLPFAYQYQTAIPPSAATTLQSFPSNLSSGAPPPSYTEISSRMDDQDTRVVTDAQPITGPPPSYEDVISK